MAADCTLGRLYARQMPTMTIRPRGPFDLATARDFAGGFPAGIGASAASDGSILMAFPVEDWSASAVVQLAQAADGRLTGPAFGGGKPTVVERQAARSLSLDHDGAGWPAVGERDPVIGALQRRYGLLRPVCFYSAYEAATSFVIGQRISMVQTRRIKERLAQLAGDPVPVSIDGEDTTIRPFPRPEALLAVTELPGLAAVKLDRLHGLARAALDGRLDTERLRGLPPELALEELRSLPGIGEWTASGVLTRGCGAADLITLPDRISREAVGHFYALTGPPTDEQWTAIADAWRPYRMWATVLLHLAWRREGATAPRT
jgi:DNA-3-methyladenine glycosylase II